MAKIPSKDTLLGSLEADAEIYFDAGRDINFTDMGLTIGAILSSLAAAAVAATHVLRWIRVLVAAVPAGVTSIQSVIDVKARSNWYFDYAAQLRALALSLEFTESPNLSDFAKKRAAIDLGMQDAWNKIGRGKLRPPLKPRRGSSADI